jgi:phosphatidate cytidylyltransferase
MSTLATRTVTGLVFAAVMAAGIFINIYTFLLLFAVITGLSLWEFYGLVLPNEPYRLFRREVGTGIGVAIFAACANFHLNIGIQYSEYLISVAIAAILALFIIELFLAAANPFDNIGRILVGLVYIAVPFCILTFIVHPLELWAQTFRHLLGNISPYYPVRVFGLLLLVWGNDSLAYLVGSRLGKTKLFPRISPGKTWEGAAGGVVGALIAAGLLYIVFPDVLPLAHWCALAVLASIFGTLGDLIESMLKRSLGVKDSGDLLPGHGGMLDRFDAFIFLIPFAAIYIWWFVA